MSEDDEDPVKVDMFKRLAREISGIYYGENIYNVDELIAILDKVE